MKYEVILPTSIRMMSLVREEACHQQVLSLIEKNYKNLREIVYCQTSQECENLYKVFKRNSTSIRCSVICSEKRVQERLLTYDNWKDSNINILLCERDIGLLRINEPEIIPRFVIYLWKPSSQRQLYLYISVLNFDQKPTDFIFLRNLQDKPRRNKKKFLKL